MPWRTIVSGRTAQHAFWTAELSLDLMERDWSLFEVPFDFYITTISLPTTTSSYFNLYAVYPDDWGFDDSFQPGMRLLLRIGLFVFVTDGEGTVEFNSNGTTSIEIDGTGGGLDYIEKEYSVLPTGLTTERVDYDFTANNPGISDMTIRRTYGTTGGRDSYMRIKITDAPSVTTPAGAVSNPDGYIPVTDEGEAPAASATYRANILWVAGGAGEQDRYYRCMKGYDDVYRWVKINSGGGPI